MNFSGSSDRTPLGKSHSTHIGEGQLPWLEYHMLVDGLRKVRISQNGSYKVQE